MGYWEKSVDGEARFTLIKHQYDHYEEKEHQFSIVLNINTKESVFSESASIHIAPVTKTIYTWLCQQLPLEHAKNNLSNNRPAFLGELYFDAGPPPARNTRIKKFLDILRKKLDLGDILLDIYQQLNINTCADNIENLFLNGNLDQALMAAKNNSGDESNPIHRLLNLIEKYIQYQYSKNDNDSTPEESSFYNLTIQLPDLEELLKMARLVKPTDKYYRDTWDSLYKVVMFYEPTTNKQKQFLLEVKVESCFCCDKYAREAILYLSELAETGIGVEENTLPSYVIKLAKQNAELRCKIDKAEKTNKLNFLTQGFFANHPNIDKKTWKSHLEDSNVCFLLFKPKNSKIADKLSNELKLSGFHSYRGTTKEGKEAVSVNLIK